MKRRLATIAAVAMLAGAGLAQTMRDEAGALRDARAQASAASARARTLEAEAKKSRDAAGRARAEQSAVAARIQSAEADIAAAEARIRIVEALRARQRARLAARQTPIVRLTAALQTMARRPPALAIVQPGSISDLVHVRALLAAALPAVQARTVALRAEVVEGDRLRERADEAVATLRAGRQTLAGQRIALTRLEAAHRLRSQGLTDSAMFEQDRAMALGERARDIVDLMRELDDQADLREQLAQLPGPMLRPRQPGESVTPPQQAMVTREGHPPYRLPVVGRLVTGLGEVSEAGVRARGLTLETAAAAQVVAPTAGRIAYAGPFRGYGQIVIIDHGRGWTTLLAGLARVTVRVGETVDQGSPIGRTGTIRPRITVELRRDGAPFDIVPMIAG